MSSFAEVEGKKTLQPSGESSCHSWDCSTAHSQPSELNGYMHFYRDTCTSIAEPSTMRLQPKRSRKDQTGGIQCGCPKYQTAVVCQLSPVHEHCWLFKAGCSELLFLCSTSQETFVFYQEALQNLALWARLPVAQSSECFVEISGWQLPVSDQQEERASFQKCWPPQHNYILLAEVSAWCVILSPQNSRLDSLLHLFI